VKVLHEALKVRTIGELERAAKSGRVRELRGFGSKTEQRILDALAVRSAAGQRFKLATALQYANPVVRWHAMKASSSP
jgi:DNA polymerase (family 10)